MAVSLRRFSVIMVRHPDTNSPVDDATTKTIGCQTRVTLIANQLVEFS